MAGIIVTKSRILEVIEVLTSDIADQAELSSRRHEEVEKFLGKREALQEIVDCWLSNHHVNIIYDYPAPKGLFAKVWGFVIGWKNKYPVSYETFHELECEMVSNLYPALKQISNIPISIRFVAQGASYTCSGGNVANMALLFTPVQGYNTYILVESYIHVGRDVVYESMTKSKFKLLNIVDRLQYAEDTALIDDNDYAYTYFLTEGALQAPLDGAGDIRVL